MTLQWKFMAAPMAELSTPALRKAIHRHSPKTLLYTEMLNAGAIAAQKKHNLPLVSRHCDASLVYQIVGNNPEVMARAIAYLRNLEPAGIDINMGCPAPDIVRQGMGSALLKDIPLARQVTASCRKAWDGPLSVKLRSGFDQSDAEHLLSFAQMLQEEGVDYITLHPRHRSLYYTRHADWSLVSLLAGELSIPVAGNGDITSVKQLAQRVDENSCAAVMIGRELVRRPWFFKLAESSHRSISINRAVEIDLILADIETLLPGELHLSRAHRYLAYATRPLLFGHSLFSRIRGLDTISTMRHTVEEYFIRNSGEAVIEESTLHGIT